MPRKTPSFPVEKKVTSHTPPTRCHFNVTFYVLEAIKQGRKPSDLWIKKQYAKRHIMRALNALHRRGVIKKVGYGTWIIIDEKKKVTSHTPPMGGTTPPHTPTFMSDKVRGHGFRLIVRVPKLRGWKDRESRLKAAGIPFTQIPQGQKVSYGGISNIWLCNRAIILHITRSFYAREAPDAFKLMLWEVTERILPGLERYLKINGLKQNKGYQVRTYQQHYGLIENALAIKYDREGKKLVVKGKNGPWLWIDNSYNLHELETGHPKTAIEDNVIVQKLFNYAKEHPGQIEAAADAIVEIRGQLSGLVATQTQIANTIMLQTAILKRMADKDKHGGTNPHKKG